MKFLTTIFIIVIILQLPSCVGGLCEEPEIENLVLVTYSIREDGNDVFGGEETRTSLQVISLETGQPVQASFNYSSENNGLYEFWLADSSHDLAARDNKTCAAYILKYGIDEVDTLKVCYKLKYEKRCETTSFEAVEVYLNNVLAADSQYGFRYHVIEK